MIKHINSSGNRWTCLPVLIDNRMVVVYDWENQLKLIDGILEGAKVGGRAFTNSDGSKLVPTDDPNGSPVCVIAHIGAKGCRRTTISELFDDSNEVEKRKVIVLDASTSTVTRLFEEGESVVWLPMKNLSAYENDAKWISEFLGLDFPASRLIARGLGGQTLKDGEQNDLAEIAKARPNLFAVLTPPKIKSVVPALSILCQGYLAVAGAGGKLGESDEVLDIMGWNRLDQGSLPQGLGTKIREVSNRQWWSEVFSRGSLESSLEAEIKGNVPDKLLTLVRWIEGNSPNSSECSPQMVARAFQALCKLEREEIGGR